MRNKPRRAHLLSTTNRRAIPLPPLSIRWREGWGERPRATLLPAGLPPLPIGWGEGWGEGSSFLRAVVLTGCAFFHLSSPIPTSAILITKQFLKQLLRPLLPLLRQHDRLGFADRVANQPFGVEPVQRVPIMPFPSAGIGEFAFALSETCQVQQGEHCVIYFVEVWFHKCDCPVVVRGLTGIFYT